MTVKNILLVYAITPKQKSAFQRMSALAQYLSEKGHHIHILTIPSPDNHPLKQFKNVTLHEIADQSFIKLAKFEKKTSYLWHKTKALYNLIVSNLIPDLNYGWKKTAIEYANKIIQEHNIDTMISSFAPVAPHLVCMELKKQHKDIKWIADMRDEMSMSPYLLPIIKRYMRHFEKQILETADAVTSVSKPIIDDFERLGTNPNVIFKEIRNGYNFTPNKNIKPTGNKKMKICYLGSFYGDINPNNFLKALTQIIDQTPDIDIEFIGIGIPLSIPGKVQNHISIHEPIPYKDVRTKMEQSDALLLILPTTNRRGVYSGKVFEYLASGKTIIGLIDPTDVAAALIKKANAGYVTDNNDIHAIQKTLLQAYDDWKNEKTPTRNWDVVDDHHRKKQTERFDRLIQEIST